MLIDEKVYAENKLKLIDAYTRSLLLGQGVVSADNIEYTVYTNESGKEVVSVSHILKSKSLKINIPLGFDYLSINTFMEYEYGKCIKELNLGSISIFDDNVFDCLNIKKIIAPGVIYLTSHAFRDIDCLDELYLPSLHSYYPTSISAKILKRLKRLQLGDKVMSNHEEIVQYFESIGIYFSKESYVESLAVKDSLTRILV
jgi:hypothetical protein